MSGSLAPRSFVGRPLSDLPTPCIVIDEATLRRNIGAMAAHASSLGVALRPHWKTTKSAEVARLQLEAGAVGLTAATVAEALALTEAGVPSVFLAYPPVGTPRVEAALEVASRADLIVGVDSWAAVSELDEAVRGQRSAPIAVRLEVDTGLGRTGVAPDAAVRVARLLAACEGLRLDGVFTHEGHVQGVGADPERRSSTGTRAGELIVDVAEAIRADGIPVESVSVGSTAGVRSAPAVAGVTEARPGTYALGDQNQVCIGTVDEADVAVSVLSRVISVERGDPLLIDAGIKAMSSDGSMHGDGRIGTVVSAAGGIVGLGHEEHGFLRGSAPLRVGAPVRIRPNHACGVINMHAHVFVSKDDTVIDVWPVLARH